MLMTTSSNISTISELLSLSGCQYRLYDIGRKVCKLTKEQFNKVELNQVPYPFPIQGHACIAIAFWQKESTVPYLWFVKIPLDERGLLNQGARNHFIAIIIEALGADMTNALSQAQEDRLKQNPYHFTPAQYKLAFVNSQLTLDLKRPASQYLSGVTQYLQQKNWDKWQQIGVQGIVDFSLRLNIKDNLSLLNESMAELPNEVLLPFCSALENIFLDATLADILIAKYHDSTNQEVNSHILRALSSSITNTKVKDFFLSLIEQQNSNELLIIIAGRAWEVLNSTEVMMTFLEQLQSTKNNALFETIFKDLVAIPTLRHILLGCIRSPNRSAGLAEAIGSLFNQTRN